MSKSCKIQSNAFDKSAKITAKLPSFALFFSTYPEAQIDVGESWILYWTHVDILTKYCQSELSFHWTDTSHELYTSYLRYLQGNSFVLCFWSLFYRQA